MKKISLFAVLALCAALLASSALAAGFPTKPIQLLIPFGAGGSADLLGRAIAKAAEKELGQPVVPVNRPGGGGAIMYNALNNAKSDGYTLGWASTGLLTVTNIGNVPFMYDQFANLVRVGYSAMPIAVRKDAPYQTWKDLVAYAKKNPGKIKIGNAGNGSGTHLTAVKAATAAGIKVIHVPLGAKRRVPSLLGGEVQAICVPLPEVAPHAISGKATILAVSTAERDPMFKSAPTFMELGYDVEMDLFRSIAVKKDVPAEIQNKLTDAFAKAASDATFQDISKKKSFNINVMKNPAFADYIKAMNDHVAKTMKEAGLKK